jgi:hypothetical protein
MVENEVKSPNDILAGCKEDRNHLMEAIKREINSIMAASLHVLEDVLPQDDRVEATVQAANTTIFRMGRKRILDQGNAAIREVEKHLDCCAVSQMLEREVTKVVVATGVNWKK